MAAAGGAGAGAGAGAAATAAASSSNQPAAGPIESIDQRVLDNLARLLETIATKDIPTNNSNTYVAPLTLTVQTATEHTYTTTLDVSIQNYGGEPLVTFKNECIFIEISPDEIGTAIRANTKEKQCFSNTKNGSRLQTTELDSLKTTATTVLQVLKLKILLAYPDVGWVTLTDEARIGDVQMTPFRLLRGDSAFYEKYGFTNKYIGPLKRAIANTEITFPASFQGRSVDEMRRGKLIDVMKDITFTQEMSLRDEVAKAILHVPERMHSTGKFVDVSLASANKKGANGTVYTLSTILFRAIVDYYSKNGVSRLEDKWDTFMFNPDSKEWNAAKNTVLLTDAVLGEFKPKNTANTAKTGGRRRHIKNLKTRRNKCKRKRKGSRSTRK